ncbi:MAG: methyltransferase domain-containing protein [Acidisphaera sp.]|nr:methyltransferase domain-containing protein [Acidisphaera sp.]
MTTSWDPSQYLRYAGERLRPALDLMARVPAESPARVVELGCGAGNGTALLHARWPKAEIIGIDGSAEMLERARIAAPGCRFVQADIAAWAPDTPPDVIFSNAALHWLSDHRTLFPRLIGLLAPGGWLAVQMPAMHAAPLRRAQSEIAANGPWATHLAGISSAADILAPEEYWDLLHPLSTALDLWETIYVHALTGEDAVVQWALGSSLRPFVDALPEALRPGFLSAYGAAVRPHYPRRPDGTTLLPFRRLFLLARSGSRGQEAASSPG